MHRDAMDAELETGRDLGERRRGALAAGQAVGHDADGVPALGLAVGEVEDVADDAADGRAHRVKDAQRLVVGRCHGQNQRSLMTTVSPGRMMVPSGTVARTAPLRSVRVSSTVSLNARGEKPPAIATALSTVMLGT